jgi:hypothetical protein
LTRARVILEENKITIQPKTLADISRVSFEVLNAMYPNAEEIVQNINVFVNRVLQ